MGQLNLEAPEHTEPHRDRIDRALAYIRDVPKRISVISFSPFDLLVYVRLCIFVLIWKHASQDYSALTYFGSHHRPPHIPHTLAWMQDATMFIVNHVLAYESAPLAIQIAGLLAGAWALWRPTRLALLLLLILISLIEYPAYVWRYQNWDFDLPMVVLIFFIIAPCNFSRAVSTDLTTSFEANLIGRTIATYMAAMYFVAGISKPLFAIDWPIIVEFGNNWRDQLLESTPYGHIVSVFAQPASYLSLAYPSLAAAVALLVLFDQLFMPLALFSKHFRIFGPLVIFLNHITIAFTLGILFSSMLVLGPGIFVPWSKLRPSSGAPIATRLGTNMRQRPLMIAGCMLAIFLVAFPAITHRAYHPYADNLQFGWRYKAPSEYTKVHQFGSLDEQSGEYKPLPRGNAGFIESRLDAYLKYIAQLIAADPKVFHSYEWYIENYLCAMRPLKSNYRLLGAFAMPEHRFSAFGPFTLSDHKKMYVLEGTPNADDVRDPYKVVRVTWRPIFDFETPTCR